MPLRCKRRHNAGDLKASAARSSAPASAAPAPEAINEQLFAQFFEIHQPEPAQEPVVESAPAPVEEPYYESYPTETDYANPFAYEF